MIATFTALVLIASLSAGEQDSDPFFIDLSEVKPKDLDVDFIDSDIPKSNSFQSRVQGGFTVTESLHHKFNYQVGLSLRTPEGSFWCGGTLISETCVLTAAHCLDSGVSGAILLFGVRDKTEAIPQHRVVDNSHFIIHKKWSAERAENDIALITFPDKVELNDYVGVIDLACNDTICPLGSKAFVSGWGRTEDNSELPNNLQIAEVPIIKNEEAARTFGSLIKPTHIAVGATGGKGTCKGDSGGPLAFQNSTTGDRYLCGCTSFGSTACTSEVPRVYTRISSYCDWICKHCEVCQSGSENFLTVLMDWFCKQLGLCVGGNNGTSNKKKEPSAKPDSSSQVFITESGNLLTS